VTDLRGTDDAGRVAQPLHPENLRTLLQQAPASVAIEGADGADGPSARAQREGGERWRVEVGGPAGPLTATLPNTDATFDVLRSWAADDGWWAEAFSWRPVGG
jgi:hypothetical protein